MWVRSQNKTLLINCDNFSIEGFPNSLDIETIEVVTGTHTTLGSYSTKEKALEVLESIQNCIGVNELCKMNKAAIMFLNEDQLAEVIVFQMPQDDEVEVQE